MNDVTDQELKKILLVGTIVGMPSVFVLVVGIALIAGATVGQAVGVAMVPTLFGGWFYGAVLFVTRAGHDETATGAGTTDHADAAAAHRPEAHAA